MKRTFGRLSFKKAQQGAWDFRTSKTRIVPSRWIVQCEPHVMIRLKHIFPRVEKSQVGSVSIQSSDEICHELEWFLLRYPLEMTAEAAALIKEGSIGYKRHCEELETIMSPTVKPRVFPLALPLRDYQAREVELCLRAKSLLVADQLGLGKTVSAIGLFTVPETLPALVVCQTHLCFQWRDNFLAKFLPKARVHIIKTGKNYPLPEAEVYIINYHKLAAWGDVLAKTVKSIVFDEVQELRHTKSLKYSAAKGVRDACDYAMGLSATPIYNFGGEIFNIMEVLSPGRLGGRDEFNREWCSYYGNDKYILRQPDAFGKYLRENFLMIRHTRAEVGRELPPVERVVQTIPYESSVIDAISDVATELARLILEGTFMESGQAARELDLKLRQATGIAKAPFVAEFVKMLVQDGQQVVLCGWHRAVYDVWMEKLKEFNPVMFTGTESAAQKQAAKTAFATGQTKVLIMSLRSGSGVDGLQLGCSTIVFGELDWSPGIHEQCIGRLNRDGSNGNVSAFFLVSDAGSDPLVAEILGLKTAQIEQMIDPDKKDNLSTLQTDAGRLKRLARDWLAHNAKKTEGTVISGLPHRVENDKQDAFALATD